MAPRSPSSEAKFQQQHVAGTASSAGIEVIGLILSEIRAGRQEQAEKLDVITEKIGGIEERLAAGDKRLDDHSDLIAKVTERSRPSEALERKNGKRKIPWYWLVILTGALTWVGERLPAIAIKLFQDQPAAVAHIPGHTP